MAWAALSGTVSFELFGQLHGIVGDQPGDHEAFFTESVRRWAAQACLPPSRTTHQPANPHPSPNPPGSQATATTQATHTSTSQTTKQPSS